MKTLKELKDWAREKGIRGFSRMNKETLLNLWNESQPLLDKEIHFDAPILIPEKQKSKKQHFQRLLKKQPKQLRIG